MCLFFLFFFKQKTAYEMRISDWSSDVCSSVFQLFLSSCLCVFARNNLVRAKAQRTQRVLGSTALAIQFAKREAGSLGESRASPSPSRGCRIEDMEVRLDLPPGPSKHVLVTVNRHLRAIHENRHNEKWSLRRRV